MRIYVFAGPTIDAARAREILAAEYLPPVTLGDVYAVVEEHEPSAIAIIDGLFDQEPSVWHKEILYALSRGVRVFGASSMGAIRAAEMAPFGMEGIGQIYAAYASGEYEDDDEVAIAHAPASEGSRALSHPMVNLRAGLSRACARGLITPQARDALTRELKATFYAERSWASVRGLGRKLDIPSRQIDDLLAFVSADPPDVKREDAVTLLTTIREHVERRTLTPHVPNFDFEPTYNWQKLVNISRNERRARAFRATHGEPALSARLTHMRQREPMRAALLLLLASREAERLGIPPATERELANGFEAFCREREIGGEQDFVVWAAANHVSADEVRALIDVERKLVALESRYADDLEHFIKLELERSRGLAPLLEAHAGEAARRASRVSGDVGGPVAQSAERS